MSMVTTVLIGVILTQKSRIAQSKGFTVHLSVKTQHGKCALFAGREPDIRRTVLRAALSGMGAGAGHDRFKRVGKFRPARCGVHGCIRAECAGLGFPAV